MNDTEKTKDEKEAAGEDWAVLPFDEQADDARWEELINETDELSTRAAAIESDFGEISTENSSPDNAANTHVTSPKSEDDDIADMNPF